MESFRVGYHECLTEMMHFLVEKEGYYSGDTLCVRLMGHLQKHYDKLGRCEIIILIFFQHLEKHYWFIFQILSLLSIKLLKLYSFRLSSP